MNTTGFDPAAFRAAVRAGVATDPAERAGYAMAAALATVAAQRARRAPSAHQPRTRAQVLGLVLRAARPARVRAQATAVGVERLDLDEEIGAWGITAAEFSGQLRDVDAGVIELHLNSPGGDVWDGLQIYNELRDHPATVNVVVNGLAASAASFIAMAGDTVRMNRGAQLMIHDAMTGTYGNETDHLRSAELLGRVSDTIAGLYADRAGGTAEDWRELMRAETWYSATEAVDAGLADEAAEEEPVAARLDAGALVAALRAGVRGALS